MKITYTGERYIPGLAAQNVKEDHERRYRLVVPYSREKRVLDIACGVGYGSDFIAETAKLVVGMDVDRGAITYASDRYGSDHCRFVMANAEKLPLATGTMDLVVSFETIEHVDQPETFLTEIQRVLAPGGGLVISTPVKKSEHLDRFHHLEFTPVEFTQLISKYFTVERVMGQRWMWTPLFWIFSFESLIRLKRFWPVKYLYRRLYGNDEVRSYSGRWWFTPNFLIAWCKRED